MRTYLVILAATLGLLGLVIAPAAGASDGGFSVGSSSGGGSSGSGSTGGSGGGGSARGGGGGGGGAHFGSGAGHYSGGYAGPGNDMAHGVYVARGGYHIVGYDSAGPARSDARTARSFGPRIGSAATAKRITTDRVLPRPRPVHRPRRSRQAYRFNLYRSPVFCGLLPETSLDSQDSDSQDFAASDHQYPGCMRAIKMKPSDLKNEPMQ